MLLAAEGVTFADAALATKCKVQCVFLNVYQQTLKLHTLSCLPHMMTLPAGADLGAFPTTFSSSLLDSSLLELSALGFAFLADGPFVVSFWIGGTFLFLASGDLGSSITIHFGVHKIEIILTFILMSNGLSKLIN